MRPTFARTPQYETVSKEEISATIAGGKRFYSPKYVPRWCRAYYGARASLACSPSPSGTGLTLGHPALRASERRSISILVRVLTLVRAGGYGRDAACCVLTRMRGQIRAI